MAVLKLISRVKAPEEQASTADERQKPSGGLATKGKTSIVAMKGVPGPGRTPGKSLMTCIKEELDSFTESPSGELITQRTAVARGLVRMAAAGSFAHINLIIEREEGKVPDRIANSDGTNLKWYGSMPTEGPEAP